MTDRPIIFGAPMIRALIAGTKSQTRRLIKDEVPEPPAHDSVNPWNVEKLKARGREPHPAPYLDSYCGNRKTPENPRGMSDRWCWWTRDDRQGLPTFKVPYVPGDRLWVREQVRAGELPDGTDGVRYLADDAWIKIANTKTAADAWVELNYYGQGRGTGPRCGGKVPSIHMPRWASRITLFVTAVRIERLQSISEADAIAEGVNPQTEPPAAQGFARAFGLHYRAHASAYANLWNSLHGADAWAANPWVAVVSFEIALANIDSLEAKTA